MNIEKGLALLLEKYKIERRKGWTPRSGGECIGQNLGKGDVPLFPWRVNRKFSELRNLIANRTVEEVSMLRSSCFVSSGEMGLRQLLYREFDIAEFLLGEKIVSVHGVFQEGEAGNAIVRTDGGIIASIEVSLKLPAGQKMLDRHELIARRGVASDMVVDTQIPQASVYIYSVNNSNTYRDVDFELYGLKEFEVEIVRAAFEIMKNPENKEDHIKQHHHLCNVVAAAIESNQTRKRLDIH